MGQLVTNQEHLPQAKEGRGAQRDQVAPRSSYDVQVVKEVRYG